MTKAEFYRKVLKLPGRNACWIWKGSYRGAGYAQCNETDEPTRLVSHWAYKMFVGPIAEGLIICHKCDNPPCVRPSHLFAGTMKDNQQDMARKGHVVHLPGRRYNTTAARQALKMRYQDPEFRSLQGQKISAALKRR